MAGQFVKSQRSGTSRGDVPERPTGEKRGVPHAIQSYYDSAYDGLFQVSRGWGHVEAPEECQEEIAAILKAIRDESAAQEDGGGESQDAQDDS